MLTESARILARRWVWAAASFVLALILGVAAYAIVPVSHVSNATVFFVPPSTQPGVKGKTNPFYSLGGSTLVMTTVVQVLVTDDETSTRLALEGNRAKYEVTPNPALNSGPSLVIKVDDKSAAMVQKTLNALVDEVRSQLEAVQTKQGVTSDLLIKLVVLPPPLHPSADHKDQIQAGAIATVGAVLLLFTLILLVERRHLARRPAQADEPTDDEPAPLTTDRLQMPESAAQLPLAGPRSGSRQAHRNARVSLTTRRKIGRANGPSRFSR